MTECDVRESGSFRKKKKSFHEEGDESSSKEEEMTVRGVLCHPWEEEGSQLTIH